MRHLRERHESVSGLRRAAMVDAPRAGGFTIVELLVVVAILVVLVAVLVPSLGQAREQARRVKCMANQRTLAQAVLGFAEEHRGYGQILERVRSGHARPIQPKRYA